MAFCLISCGNENNPEVEEEYPADLTEYDLKIVNDINAESKLVCKLYENDGKVIPVEVKAATNTQAKSYKQFSKKYEPKVGFKASLKNIAMNMVHETNTVNIPLYLLWDMDFYE